MLEKKPVCVFPRDRFIPRRTRQAGHRGQYLALGVSTHRGADGGVLGDASGLDFGSRLPPGSSRDRDANCLTGAHHIGVLVYWPLAPVLLTGTRSPVPRFAPADDCVSQRGIQRGIFELNLRRARTAMFAGPWGHVSPLPSLWTLGQPRRACRHRRRPAASHCQYSLAAADVSLSDADPPPPPSNESTRFMSFRARGGRARP